MEKTFRPKTTRRVPRVAVNFPVTLNAGKKRSRCHAHQLSEFGILVTPKQDVPIGETVQTHLLFELPNPTLSLFGIVAYALDSGTGIRFTNVPPEQQFTLKRYVEALRKRPEAGPEVCRL